MDKNKNNVSANGGSFDEHIQNLLSKEELAEIDEQVQLMTQIINARKEHNLTQRELAKRCGIKQPAIARMESLNTDPRLSSLVKVLSTLGKKLVVVDKSGKESDASDELAEMRRLVLNAEQARLNGTKGYTIEEAKKILLDRTESDSKKK